MKKFLALFVISALALVGCSAADTEDKITIAVEKQYADYFRELAKEFSNDKDYTLEVVESGMWDLLDALPTQQGNSADIFMIPNDRIGELVDQRLITNIGFTPSGYTDNSIAAATYHDNVYILPMSTDTTLLVYNADVTDTVPETLKEIDPSNFAGKFTDFYFSSGFIYSNGGYIFNDGDINQIGLNNEGSVMAGEQLQTLYQSGHDHWTLMRDDTVSFDIMQEALINGDVEYIITGPWAVSDLLEAGVNVAAVPIPSWDGSYPYKALTGTKGLAVNAYSNNVEEAQEFLEFIATSEHANTWHEVTQEVSPHTGVSYQAGTLSSILFDATEAGEPMPNNAEFGKVWEPMADALKQIAAGEDVKEALDAAVNTIERDIKDMQ